MVAVRIGQGVDLHEFCEGESLILGGVSIPSERGLKGHSDADVLTHALMDALLGAAGLPDIGHYFPPSDPRWKGARSVTLLKQVMDELSSRSWYLMNTDISLVLERPKIAPYIPEMKRTLSEILHVPEDCIGIKATTAEGLGALGRHEGALALAVVLIEKR
jgi:2-C-methyl-D-erythritol 2,4-cyclodiphosphate synthase